MRERTLTDQRTNERTNGHKTWIEYMMYIYCIYICCIWFYCLVIAAPKVETNWIPTATKTTIIVQCVGVCVCVLQRCAMFVPYLLDKMAKYLRYRFKSSWRYVCMVCVCVCVCVSVFVVVVAFAMLLLTLGKHYFFLENYYSFNRMLCYISCSSHRLFKRARWRYLCGCDVWCVMRSMSNVVMVMVVMRLRWCFRQSGVRLQT